MRSAFASLALAALAMASPRPGGVSSAIAPSSSPPAGCSENHPLFSIQVENVTSSGKRSLERRDTSLTMTLSNGVLTDPEGRTGYIASNYQFQFDDPPQAGAIYTSGFSVCSNGSLAIGGQAVWYKCLSGTFYNLYDESTGGQCSPVYIMAVAASGGSSASATPAPSGPASTSAVVTEQSDGQPTATIVSSVSAECSEYVDGQPQCSSAVATPSAECSEYVDGQPQCSSAVATPSAECSEYVDGQPQCSSVAPTPSAECSEYVDGQPQCSSVASPTPSAECSEYVDGQPQCSSVASPTPTAECSEYVDGQPQCSTVASVASTGAYASASYTGPAITNAAAPTGLPREIFGLAAGVLAVAML